MPYHNYLTLSCLTNKTTCFQLPRGSVIEKNSPVKYVKVLTYGLGADISLPPCLIGGRQVSET